MTADSLGVETEDGPDFFPRPPASIKSGLVAALMTFALGRAPRAAIFATTPCRSIPASAKDGLGAGKGGSSHLSNPVFGFSPLSGLDLADSVETFAGTVANGELYLERVGRGVKDIAMDDAASASFFATASRGY